MRPLTMTCFLLSVLAGACATPDDKDDTDVTDDTDAADTDVAGDTDDGDTDAEDTDGDTDVAAPLDVAGTWADPWGTLHEVSDTAWIQTYIGAEPMTFLIAQYSNDGQVLIAQNGPANTYDPNKWSRFDWAEADSVLYFCQSVFDADTEDAALAATAGDASDLEGGCGGYGWSVLQEPLFVRGSWSDDFGSAHTIHEATWEIDDGKFEVSAYDNAAQVVIARNSVDNVYFPTLWSRFDWTVSGTDLYFCQTAYNAESELAAEGTARANDADLAEGCSGFGWSQLLAPL